MPAFFLLMLGCNPLQPTRLIYFCYYWATIHYSPPDSSTFATAGLQSTTTNQTHLLLLMLGCNPLQPTRLIYFCYCWAAIHYSPPTNLLLLLLGCNPLQPTRLIYFCYCWAAIHYSSPGSSTFATTGLLSTTAHQTHLLLLLLGYSPLLTAHQTHLLLLLLGCNPLQPAN